MNGRAADVRTDERCRSRRSTGKPGRESASPPRTSGGSPTPPPSSTPPPPSPPPRPADLAVPRPHHQGPHPQGPLPCRRPCGNHPTDRPPAHLSHPAPPCFVDVRWPPPERTGRPPPPLSHLPRWPRRAGRIGVPVAGRFVRVRSVFPLFIRFRGYVLEGAMVADLKLPARRRARSAVCSRGPMGFALGPRRGAGPGPSGPCGRRPNSGVLRGGLCPVSPHPSAPRIIPLPSPSPGTGREAGRGGLRLPLGRLFRARPRPLGEGGTNRRGPETDWRARSVGAVGTGPSVVAS